MRQKVSNNIQALCPSQPVMQAPSLHYITVAIPFQVLAFFLSADSSIPGTSEVSPKLKLPVDSLVKYLKVKHGLYQNSQSPLNLLVTQPLAGDTA